MNAAVKIRFCVPLSARPGDRCRLHGNGGAGEIDWETPVSDRWIDLFPGGAGNYGAGLSPAGIERAGMAYPVGVLGAGLCPAGLEPAGLGAVVIEAEDRVDECGDYKYGFLNTDAAGNPTEGSPQEIDLEVHVTPPAPLGLKYSDYDPDTDVLTLAVHDPTTEPLMPVLPGRVPGGSQPEGSMDGIEPEEPGFPSREIE